MKKLVRGLLAALALCFGVLPAFAEGESTPTISVTDATEFLTALQTAQSTWWTTAKPIVIQILGLAFVLVLFWVGFRLVAKITRRAA